MQTGSNAIVDKPWQASFENPARFRQGDPMFVTGESDLWDGQYHWINTKGDY